MALIKFAVSSHINYVNTTRPILNPTLWDAGVPPGDIFWCVHNPAFNDYAAELYPTWKNIFVPHNSLDFTGLITVVELGLDSDWWFLLHDTTYVGPRFYKNLQALDLTEETVPLSIHNVHPGANMGLYSREFISANKDKILSLKNPSKLDEDVHKFKRMLVETEDDLFRGASKSLNGVAPKYIGPKDFYGTGQQRLIEHFQNIDLYKVKANWSGYVDRWNVTP